MIKNYLCMIVLIAAALTVDAGPAGADDKIEPSTIVSVKLYQNQAEITRRARVSLSRGQNNIILGGLPDLLYDWSARARLPEDFKGKILSLEVEKKALVAKRQKNILEIEERLDALRERDRVLLDELKDIKSQDDFLNSIMTFVNQTASKELATRIPEVKVWDNTLNYVSGKRQALLKRKREIEKKREDTGKEIQKWEFELTQIAGYGYFNTYQTLNRVVLQNSASMEVQQFAEITSKYAERDQLLKRPAEKVDIEKQFVVDVFSGMAAEADITFSYVIPNTYWQMQYDIRASSRDKSIDLVVYGNIYQKTGEDWRDVALSLSTGSPVNAIQPPELSPWYLDVYKPPVYKEEARVYESMKRGMKKGEAEAFQQAAAPMEAEEKIPETVISEKGPYFEITLPMNQSILSSSKYQKKLIQDYSLKGERDVKFYYELTPEKSRSSYLRVKAVNNTNLPWLSGESQIFLENEFMGKVDIPFTPAGKEEDFILGMESRITAEKVLVKKYEDTAGVFGGNRRILYRYKVTVENQMPQKTELSVRDLIPVSRNEKIRVEIQNLSLPFIKDENFENSTEYERGIRKWNVDLESGRKKEITYEVVVSFDKDADIRGLR